MSVTTRLASVGDAEELAALLRANRDFLRPFEPDRSPTYYTSDGQRRVLDDMLRQHDTVPHLIVEDDRIVGRIVLSNIVRGPLMSASLGYWVARHANGRGVATAAADRLCRIAFDELGLHRVEAGTLVDNLASQRVLERIGFQRFGLAPRYLRINGEWRDHVLFQRLSE